MSFAASYSIIFVYC